MGAGGLRLREEGAPAERATAREAGKFLKSEKNSVLENDQNARLSPFPLSSLFPFPLFSLNFFFLLLLLRCCAPTTFRIQRAKPLGQSVSQSVSHFFCPLNKIKKKKKKPLKAQVGLIHDRYQPKHPADRWLPRTQF